MGTARDFHAVAVLAGKLYAVGGSDYDGRLSSVERYDPAAGAWEAVTSMAAARVDGFALASCNPRRCTRCEVVVWLAKRRGLGRVHRPSPKRHANKEEYNVLCDRHQTLAPRAGRQAT